MSLASQGIKFGAHTPIASGGDLLESVNAWEVLVDRRMDIVNHFRAWNAPSGQLSADTLTSLKQASGQGRLPMVTWMPAKTAKDMTGPLSLPAIIAGLQDEYIDAWANAVRELGTPIAIRPMHEMNGTWYPWSGDPEAYVRTWRRLVDRFIAAGATNAKFVWCVNASDQPKGNALENYWPGEDWVDVLGVDGYNNYGGWRPFDRIIRPAYDRLCRLSNSLPIWVCETASAEGDGSKWAGTGYWSKPEWISDMFSTEGMERIEAVCWFNEHNKDSYDWRVDTSGSSLRELRTELGAARGYVAAPGPYVPPIPDRVKAEYTAPGQVSVTWRQVPSFCRGYQVRISDNRGFVLTQQVYKPNTFCRVNGVPAGDWSVTVRSWTNVRTSAPSTAVPVTVVEAF